MRKQNEIKVTIRFQRNTTQIHFISSVPKDTSRSSQFNDKGQYIVTTVFDQGSTNKEGRNSDDKIEGWRRMETIGKEKLDQTTGRCFGRIWKLGWNQFKLLGSHFKSNEVMEY